jgi:hypothetical protein
VRIVGSQRKEQRRRAAFLKIDLQPDETLDLGPRLADGASFRRIAEGSAAIEKVKGPRS